MLLKNLTNDLADLRFARPKIRGWEAQNEGLMKIMSKRCGIRPPGGRNSLLDNSRR